MEEDEYRSTYNTLTRIPCVFEKALTNHKAQCDCSLHFCLADREGYACKSDDSSEKCMKLLKILREKSRFALKLSDQVDALPHNMEIRVQAGGLQGLSKLPGVDNAQSIHAIIDQSLQQYGSFQNLPYSEIIQSITQYQGRLRRKR